MKKPSSPSFLAFDLGAESGRAVIGRLEEIHRFLVHWPQGE